MSFINVEGDEIQPPRIDENYSLNGVYWDEKDIPGHFILELKQRGKDMQYHEIYISPFSPMLENFARALLATKRKHEQNRQDFYQGGKNGLE